jgi:FkbM family methyltransferase
MNTNLQATVESFLQFYSANRHKKELTKLTDVVLAYALSARGYNNYRSDSESGEAFFINEILAKSRPKLCIDVGANIGEYSVALMKATDTQVVAFEPLPIAFQILSQKSKEFPGRLIAEKMGIGANQEELFINYDPSETSFASFSKDVEQVDYLKNTQSLKAPLVTLDWYCETNKINEIDLIKIDVEGFESEVFAGAKNVFNQIRPRFIQMEFNWHQMFRNAPLYYFSKQLHGYETYQLLPNGWAKRDPKDPVSNIFLFSNFVFVRSGEV